MDKLVINGGKALKGSVLISGSKNSALPILAATLLTDEKCIINNVPKLQDITTMIKILKALGVRVHESGNKIEVDPKGYKKCVAPYKLVSTMRASICVLGPLLGKLKKAEVSFPGGCVIGPRPIDLHLKGIRALGANVKIEGGYILADGKNLKGSHIYLGGHFGSSVLATANTMMASVLAKGQTIIENAACEPEVEDLAEFLIKMGAKIKGHKTPRIEIEGVKRLKGATHSVIPDRIETVTMIIAGAITKGDVTIKNARPDHIVAVIDKLRETGLTIKEADNELRVRVERKLRPIYITTLPYPGFPTDAQAQLMSLLSITEGISVITEKIFPERFLHISELNRMGADIALEGSSAIVKGVRCLSGAPVMASDLRASAALVLAGLVAKGKTEISRVYHLDRGYERLEEKMNKLGAEIIRVKDDK